MTSPGELVWLDASVHGEGASATGGMAFPMAQKAHRVLHAKKLWEGDIVDHARKLVVCRAGQHLQGSVFKLHFLLNLGKEPLSLHALLWCAQLGRLDLMLSELLDSPVCITSHAQQGRA